ncbi:hypothetical protein MKX73_05960 [Solibacillus sp. FSL W7-1436]|uniref:hypothetical protein n=1 Tax=unclassified Solibacillus TaxID=2637870 RepID=UPI0030FAF7B7
MDKHFKKMYNFTNNKKIGVVDLTIDIPVKPPEKVDNTVNQKIKSLKSNDIHEMVKALGLDGNAFGQNLMDVYKQSR